MALAETWEPNVKISENMIHTCAYVNANKPCKQRRKSARGGLTGFLQICSLSPLRRVFSGFSPNTCLLLFLTSLSLRLPYLIRGLRLQRHLPASLCHCAADTVGRCSHRNGEGVDSSWAGAGFPSVPSSRGCLGPPERGAVVACCDSCACGSPGEIRELVYCF